LPRTIIVALRARDVDLTNPARSECLDWLLILNQQQLERSLEVFVTHYNGHNKSGPLGADTVSKAGSGGANAHQRLATALATSFDSLGGCNPGTCRTVPT
jgi:hypothetical protein